MGYFDTSILASHTLEEFKSAVNRKHWNLFHTAPIPDEYKSKISYIPNSFGFRDTDMIADVDICYYGCSITYGVGVPLESRYTNLIDNELNYASNNFAVGGSSLEDAAHLFITTSKFVKMKTAFFLLPDYLRTTFPIQVEKDKTMSNNKQSSVDWFLDELIKEGYIKRLPVTQLQQAKEMEIMGMEMFYSDGYREGYKRALELIEWKIQNELKDK